MGKRIGIDCRMWNETGVGRYTRNLVRILQTKDSENHYFLFALPQNYEAIMQTIENRNFTVVSVDIHWHSFAEQLVLPWKLLEYNLDLMHFPYFSFPLLYTRPFITTIHDMTPWLFATGKASTLPAPLYWLKQLAYKFQQRVGAMRAVKIITVSESAKQDIIKFLHVSPKKVVVTYEGVDAALHVRKNAVKKSDIFASLNIQPKKYFLTVGNFYPHKNLERLVLAFQKVHALHKDIQLVMVGKKDFFGSRLEEFAKEHLITGIIFAGFVPDNDLAELYQKSLSTVYPSLVEGFGLLVLESLANDSLIITSNIPVLQEIGGDNLLYCDPYSVDDIARSLEDVIGMTEKRRAEQLEQGQKILRKFSWTKMGDETLAVYNALIA